MQFRDTSPSIKSARLATRRNDFSQLNFSTKLRALIEY